MPRDREPEGSVRDCDALEGLTDKLRSGEFSEAILAAQKAKSREVKWEGVGYQIREVGE